MKHTTSNNPLRMVLFSPDVIAQLKELRRYAIANPFSVTMLKEIADGHQPVAGEREGFKVFIPVGVKVVFTIEDMPKRIPGQDAHDWRSVTADSECVKMEHLSISVAAKGKLPNPHVVQEVMNHLDMGKLEESIFNTDYEYGVITVLRKCVS